MPTGGVAGMTAGSMTEPQKVTSGAADWGMSRWRVRYRRLEPALLGTSCLILFLALWQVGSDAHWLNPTFVSSPWAVAKDLWHYIPTSQFLADLKYTGLTFIYGLALSLVVGLVLGVAMGLIKRVRWFFDYFFSLLYASPRIALIPLFVLWFGIGRNTGIAMVFLLAVFPIMINTTSGVQHVDETLVEMARSQDATRLQLMRTVILPGSLPQIISGIRLAIGNALIGVVVAEFLAGSTSGLGYRMQLASQNFQTAQVFAGLVVISALGLILTQLLKIVERYFQRWRTA